MVGCAQEAPVEGGIEERLVIVSVLAEDEDVDAVSGRRVDLLRHDLPVGTIPIAPERHPRLAMTGELIRSLAHGLPFALLVGHETAPIGHCTPIWCRIELTST